MLKYEYIVHPGGEPENIRMQYEGIDLLTVMEDRALNISTNKSSFINSPPNTFQRLIIGKQKVDAHYMLFDNCSFGC